MVSFFAGFPQNITNLLKHRCTKYENVELYFVAEGHLVFLNVKLQ